MAEIESGDVLQEYSTQRVVRVGPHFVVKLGLQVSLTEGENMLFMQDIGATFVPEVFALYSQPTFSGQPKNYIVMEYIHGQTLRDLWPTLEAEEKDRIADQLRSMISSFRGLTPPGFFGCIGRRPFEECMFWTAPADEVPDGLISGPFSTEEQFNKGLIEKYRYNSGLEHKAAYYHRVLPLVLQGHEPRFTHGDFQRKNIVIRDDGTAFLIDWETAGWYPEYWEYTLAIFACGSWKDDWHQYVGKILQEYPFEYAWFEMLRRELWS